MKTHFLFNRAARLGASLTPIIAIALLTSCASLDAFTPAPSSLPIETKSTSPGTVVSARAFEKHDRLFVTGSWKKNPGYALHYATHVDIELLAQDGSVLASIRDDIKPAPSIRVKVKNSRVSFVGSFPAALAQKASRIRIISHAHETE